MSDLKKNNRGFATVELLVTIITIGIIFGAFVTTFTTIQNINKKTKDIQDANVAAFSKMQEYENTEFANIPDSSTDGSLEEVEDFTDELPASIAKPRSAKVFVNTISPTLKHVVVNVEYGQNPSVQTIQYVNFIQVNGVGR